MTRVWARMIWGVTASVGLERQKIFFDEKMRTDRRVGVPPITGGCLNSSVVVSCMERETRSCLPSIIKEG
jgi:hypothetical protein